MLKRDVMRNRVKLIPYALSYCLLSFTLSFGCSLALSPITKFDPKEYVFTGRIVGIVGPFESKKFEGAAWGLQVKVEEKVYLPKTPADFFEVIPYELMSDCATAGTSKEELAKYYPIGTKVKVIARESKLLPSKLSNGNIRLEIASGNWSDISRNNYEDGRQMADAQSVFDYKSFKQVTPADYVSSFMPFLDAKGALPDFELRKDLLRLRNTKSENERIGILERLMYYPICCGPMSYYGVAQSHLKNPNVVKLLNNRREAWIDAMNREDK